MPVLRKKIGFDRLFNVRYYVHKDVCQMSNSIFIKVPVKPMDSKTTIPISEARKRIFEIAEEVQKPDTYYTLTENGRAKAVLMSAEQFDSIMETIDILSDPAVLDNIKKAEEEYKKGDYQTWEELKKEIGFGQEKESTLVCEKPKKKYQALKK